MGVIVKNGIWYCGGDGSGSDGGKNEGVIEKEVQSKIITSTNEKVNQSSFFRNGFEGYKAFNGNSANPSTCQGGWLAASTDTTPWISYTFDEEIKLTKMDIEVCNNSGNITKTFKIQGSNDERTYPEPATDEKYVVQLSTMTGKWGQFYTGKQFTFFKFSSSIS